MKQFALKYAIAWGLICIFTLPASANEVLEQTGPQVIIREHPKTGRPYVSIVPSDVPADPFTGQRSRYSRPDYRMLDSKIKSGEIPYDGPHSNRTKVYVFAASIATLGVAGGTVVLATASTAASAAAAGGGASYAAAGSAVAGSATAAAVIATQPNPQKDSYRRSSESTLLEVKQS